MWRDEGKIAIEFMYTVDGKTKKATRFLPMAEAKMWDELYSGMNAAMVYGKRQTRQGRVKMAPFISNNNRKTFLIAGTSKCAKAA